jgi:hypothetical protein
MTRLLRPVMTDGFSGALPALALAERLDARRRGRPVFRKQEGFNTEDTEDHGGPRRRPDGASRGAVLGLVPLAAWGGWSRRAKAWVNLPVVEGRNAGPVAFLRGPSWFLVSSVFSACLRTWHSPNRLRLAGAEGLI